MVAFSFSYLDYCCWCWLVVVLVVVPWLAGLRVCILAWLLCLYCGWFEFVFIVDLFSLLSCGCFKLCCWLCLWLLYCCWIGVFDMVWFVLLLLVWVVWFRVFPLVLFCLCLNVAGLWAVVKSACCVVCLDFACC